MTSCPTASPISNAVRVSWIIDADVPNSAAIVGNADRYMSMDSGVTAESSASTAISITGVAARVVVVKESLAFQIDLTEYVFQHMYSSICNIE